MPNGAIQPVHANHLQNLENRLLKIISRGDILRFCFEGTGC